MIPHKDTLPDDLAKWRDIQVSLPRLSQDSADSCPFPQSKIMDYVAIESGDCGDAREDSLKFIRTARLDKLPYWLWSYTSSDGDFYYVCLGLNARGQTILSLTSTHDLTPEQYILADYFGLITES